MTAVRNILCVVSLALCLAAVVLRKWRHRGLAFALALAFFGAALDLASCGMVAPHQASTNGLIPVGGTANGYPPGVGFRCCGIPDGTPPPGPRGHGGGCGAERHGR